MDQDSPLYRPSHDVCPTVVPSSRLGVLLRRPYRAASECHSALLYIGVLSSLPKCLNISVSFREARACAISMLEFPSLISALTPFSTGLHSTPFVGSYTALIIVLHTQALSATAFFTHPVAPLLVHCLRASECGYAFMIISSPRSNIDEEWALRRKSWHRD